MKVVIVGGVAGGASAAARIRRLDETAEIIVFERTGYVSYANCGLPYFVGGVITDPGALTLQTPESFLRKERHSGSEYLSNDRAFSLAFRSASSLGGKGDSLVFSFT